MRRSHISVAAISICFALAATVIHAQSPPAYPSYPIVTQPDTVWPLIFQGQTETIQVFQPQPDRLEGDKLMARAAVSLRVAGATEPVFGTVWLTARIATERDARTATILDLTVRKVRFPDATADQQNHFTQIIQQQIPQMRVTFSLDQLMASLDVAEKEKIARQELSTVPPKIIYIPAVATLVLIDGQPQLQPVANVPGLMRVANSPFVILLDTNSQHYYLKAGDFWYSATDPVGPWINVGSIPAQVLSTGNLLTTPPAPPPGSAVPQPPAQQVNPGQIIVSEEPAELISTDGQPLYSPLAGTTLLYATNTSADVFFELGTRQTFVLLSGRWFAGPSLQGPWTYMPADKLPPAFAQIPADSAKGYVLASVAGTPQARDARLDAQVPQTAAVDRNAGQSLVVSYDGQPQFDAVQNSPVSYAVNTPEAVLLVNGAYFCCHQGVWYQSSIPQGPWAVATAVPDSIYTLPPSCPDYYVRYCYVYDVTPTTVYCGYLPGYTGCFIYGPTVVFGTGFHYPGWYRSEYFSRPHTWGFGAIAMTCRQPPGALELIIDTTADGLSVPVTRMGGGVRGYIDYHSLPRGNYHDEHFAGNTYINRLNVYNRSDNIRRNVVVNRDNYYRTQIGHNDLVRPEPIRAPRRQDQTTFQS